VPKNRQNQTSEEIMTSA